MMNTFLWFVTHVKEPVIFLFLLYKCIKLTTNPMTLYSTADEPLSDFHIQKSHDLVIPERNVASHSSACCISAHCGLTRLSYACQKLSHWHLTKNIYWLGESGCSNCTAIPFPNHFLGTERRNLML